MQFKLIYIEINFRLKIRFHLRILHQDFCRMTKQPFLPKLCDLHPINFHWWTWKMQTGSNGWIRIKFRVNFYCAKLWNFITNQNELKFDSTKWLISMAIIVQYIVHKKSFRLVSLMLATEWYLIVCMYNLKVYHTCHLISIK